MLIQISTFAQQNAHVTLVLLDTLVLLWTKLVHTVLYIDENQIWLHIETFQRSKEEKKHKKE